MKGPAGTSPRAGRPPALIQPGMSRVRFSATALTGQKKKHGAVLSLASKARVNTALHAACQRAEAGRGGPGWPQGVA